MPDQLLSLLTTLIVFIAISNSHSVRFGSKAQMLKGSKTNTKHYFLAVGSGTSAHFNEYNEGCVNGWFLEQVEKDENFFCRTRLVGMMLAQCQ